MSEEPHIGVPDAETIRDMLNAPDNARTFSKGGFRQANSMAGMKRDYKVSDTAFRAAQRIRATGTRPRVANNPFNAIPKVSSIKEQYETIQVYADVSSKYFEKDSDRLDSRGPAKGWSYENYAMDDRSYEGETADLTQAPTSTTNPARPRTVAAGYDSSRRCLTVVFRDGTYYNYYDVPQSLWNNFTRAYSPGRFIAAHLDNKPRGVADVTDLPEYAREALYRITRTGQIQRDGLTGTQTANARRRAVQRYGKNLGGTGRKRIAQQKLTER